MIDVIGGRVLDRTKPVRIYRNLHFRGALMYSVQQGGLVVAYTDFLVLSDVRTVVVEPDRRRAKKNSCKNVHAFFEGFVAKLEDFPGMYDHISRLDVPVQIRYDIESPTCFVHVNGETRTPFYGADYVVINQNGVGAILDRLHSNT